MHVEFTEPASIELDDAIKYYNLQVDDLGGKFLDEVLETVTIITKYPQLWSHNSKNTRKAVLRKFPYNLIYSELIELEDFRIDDLRIAELNSSSIGNPSIINPKIIRL